MNSAEELYFSEKLGQDIAGVVNTVTDKSSVLNSLEKLRKSISKKAWQAMVGSLTTSRIEKINSARELYRSVLQGQTGLLSILDNLLDGAVLEVFTLQGISTVMDSFEVSLKPRKSCKVSMAIQLTDDDLKLFRLKLEQRLKSKLFLALTIKPNIIGGFIVEFGSQVIDASLETAYENYRREWVKNMHSEEFS